MTPEPPASPDGSSLPSRHRPSLGNLAQDTTEIDLWAFEDDLNLPDDLEEPETGGGKPRSPGGDIPVPRDRQPGKTRDLENHETSQAAAGEERIRMDVTRKPPKSRSMGPVSGPAKPESEFDDLDQWEDVRHEPEIEDLPVLVIPDMIEVEVPAVVEKRHEETTEPPPDRVVLPAVEESEDDEFSPALREDAVPISLRPHLRLSKVERIGLITLLVLLVGGVATVFLTSLHRLPVESAKAGSNDFPIKGDHLTITSATSYWRAPISDGPEADTFRRGTELLPVLEIATSGGPATIRVFFRDDEGRTIGDAITRSINSGGNLKIPATAGFDDPGMHAAYRTGESKPWTIEVWEIPSGNASDGKSRKLFEMNISTDRH